MTSSPSLLIAGCGDVGSRLALQMLTHGCITVNMKYYSSRKQWDKYFKVKNNFPDLRSVAASTAHKAQGSTYDTVIIDLADIGTCTNLDQTARMIYVGLSRPRSRLYIRGQLPARYFP